MPALELTLFVTYPFSVASNSNVVVVGEEYVPAEISDGYPRTVHAVFSALISEFDITTVSPAKVSATLYR